MQLFELRHLQHVMSKEMLATLDYGYLLDAYEHLHASRDDVQAALALDRVTYLPEDLLTKVDRCSMQHALEVRSPFMDHELVQFAAGLSTPALLKGGGKRLLRLAFEKDVPQNHFNRRKMGFAVPIGEWFRTSLRDMLRGMLLARDSVCRQCLRIEAVEHLLEQHEHGPQDHAQRLYALLMLELWAKHVRDGGDANASIAANAICSK
jgi:asparagine synthase (glutamine-hydrolysing)